MSGEQKWINLSFIFIAGLGAWLLNQTATMVIRYVRIENPTVLGVLSSSAVAAIGISALTTFWYSRRPHVQTFCHEVILELKKVVWPPVKTSYLSTIVVVVSVFIMAMVLGVFDWVCTTLVGLVLNV